MHRTPASWKHNSPTRRRYVRNIMLRFCMTTWLDRLRENHAQLNRFLFARDQLIVSARLAGFPVSAIADAAGLSRMQAHRILNETAPTLRLVGPDPDGMWTDSAAKRGLNKPEWLVASEGSGAVHGWYFEENDAVTATGANQYNRRIEHTPDGQWK